MDPEWKGRSRGNVLGYKIFIFFIRYLGIGAAYFLLYFVAFYFLFFSREGTRSAHYYLHHRLGRSRFRAWVDVFRNYLIFGKTLIDRASISSGLQDRYTYDSDGVALLRQMLAEKKGGLLISAHVGNFEIAEHFLSELDSSMDISLLTTDMEHQAIKDYLESVSKKSTLKFIIVKDDMSHIFQIHEALSQNGVICMTGDRYFPGTKTLTAPLLGKDALFPAGPFLLGSRLNVPVAFVYVMKERRRHYHLYARRAEVPERDANALLNAYCRSVEWMLGEYPLQWFNYFEFWKEEKAE